MKIQMFGALKKANIKRQLHTIYFVAVILPITIIGSFLLINTYRLLTNYHRDLLESDNLRVKNILFEITTQAYNISEELTFSDDIRAILKDNYYFKSNLVKEVDALTSLDNYNNNYAEIDEIEIYADNPTLNDYKQFHYANEEIRKTQWYQMAVKQSSVFWVPMTDTDKYGNRYWNLCLVRKIPMVNSNYNAVLVIKLSDNYLKTRIGSREYTTMVSVDKGPIFFSSEREAYGKEQIVFIDYDNNYYKCAGNIQLENEVCFVDVSTLPLYQSDSKIYICTMSGHAYSNIKNIIYICLAIILFAILIPGIIIHFFTVYFTSRVLTLRHAMYQASNEDYEITDSVSGQDELSEAFSDLEVMVQKIKQKDAEMYEARIKEKELINEQQQMEFKMLASQINPHFLYNTLETIRMKAFTAGDREAATSIKLLGKSMRYVLENTGTTFTTLIMEIEHVMTYLAIQKMRFGDKFESVVRVEEDVQVKQLYILPLLLQPIVENALLHGLEETEEGGRITISVYKSEEMLFIDIQDNGRGMAEEELAVLRRNVETKDISRNKSIGLYNINQRVKLCYGNNWGIRINSELNVGTTVRLMLPIEKMKKLR
ncbi:MAG: histidine kinase [Clostridiales bacterium]|nr:histidine kinase [Clostridiales bacterium]